jgi:hypothetical protein
MIVQLHMKRKRQKMQFSDAVRRGLRRASWAIASLAMAFAMALIASVLQANVAWAKEKTVAVYVEGPGADSIRSAIVAAVPHGIAVADPDAFRSALEDQGLQIPFGKALGGHQRGATLNRVRKAAAGGGIDAALLAQVSHRKKDRSVLLLLVATSGGSGDLEDEVVLGLRPSRADASKLGNSVSTALVDYRPTGEAKEPEKKEEAEKPESKEEKPEAASDENAPASENGEAAAASSPEGKDKAGPSWEHPHGSASQSLVSLELGAEAVGRQFGYTNGYTPNLRTYGVFPTPAVSLQAEVYPLADSQTRFLRDVGFIGGYSTTLLLKSTVDNQTTSTTGSAYYGGVRVRIHPSDDAGPMFGISLSYVAQAFTFGDTSSGALPSVSYQAVRPGLDLRVPIGPAAFLAQAGFRGAFSAGDVALRFHDATTFGIDASIGGAYAVARGWEIRVIGDYERWMYTFTPLSTDEYQAKGAVDNFGGVRLALAGIF